MLEQLRREHAAELVVLEPLERGEGVGLLDVESLPGHTPPCPRRRRRRAPRRLHPEAARRTRHGRSRDRAPAPRREVLDIRALAGRDLRRVAAHARLEREVVWKRVGAWLCGDGGWRLRRGVRSTRRSRSSISPRSACAPRARSRGASSRLLVPPAPGRACARARPQLIVGRPARLGLLGERRTGSSLRALSSSAKWSSASLNARCSAANGPTYQLINLRRTRLTGYTTQPRSPARRTIGRSTATDQRASASLRASRGASSRFGGPAAAFAPRTSCLSRWRCSDASTEETLQM